MNLIPTQPNPSWTMSQLRKHFGMIPAERILLQPTPGTATEKDAFRLNDHGGRCCELVEGVLLEKPMGAEESGLALWLARWILEYLDTHPLGKVLGEAALLRLLPGLLRAPDVSFITWERYPPGKPAVPAVSPDLAVEVISKGNTRKELSRKRRDYFANGTRLVWLVDERKQFVEVYTSAKKPDRRLGIEDTLDGGDVLPGFQITVRKLFSHPAPDRKS